MEKINGQGWAFGGRIKFAEPSHPLTDQNFLLKHNAFVGIAKGKRVFRK